MNPLPVVEAARHQGDDVRDGLRRLDRIGFELERAFRRFNDNHRRRRLRDHKRRRTKT
jgi:hypothetical protein